MSVAGKVIEAVKSKAIRHFFLVAGCDGQAGEKLLHGIRGKTAKDTVVLTLACGKFRFFDKQLGDIGGFPGFWTSDSAMTPTRPSRLPWRSRRLSMWA